MKPTTRDGILRGGMAALIRLLILAAAGVSAYLLSVSMSGGTAVGCGPGSACDEVLHSRWAYVLGIPVSALALVVDVALLLTTFGCGPKSTPKQRRGAWEILVPCALLVLGAALWFIALQAVVLHRFCPWCMTAHTCGAVAAILLLMRVPMTDGRERHDKSPAIPRSSVIRFAVIAVVVLALLGVAQTLAPRKTFTVTTLPNVVSNATVMTGATNFPPKTNASPIASSLKTNTPVQVVLPQTNVAAALPNTSSNMLDVFGGRIRLDLTQAPVWGSPAAPFKLISLYDYTCHHCRDMHPRVVEVKRAFGDKLAIVSLPMPLDAQCNYLLPRTSRAQMNACIYAKLGLIVWRAKRDAIETFDDWLFGFQQPPPLLDVTNKAIQLVGTVPFEIASRDPWIEQQLRTAIDIFAIDMRELKNSSMPQFLIGTNLVSGTLTTDELRALVAKYVEPVATPAP